MPALSFTFFVSILQHTPGWVWLLLAALIALGLYQARPHSITLRRMTALPLAMMVLSLFGVISVFGSGAALAAWATGALVAAGGTLHGGIGTKGTRWIEGDQRFLLPGSWLPMALILGIFCVKFGVAVSLALQPTLRSAPEFALAASLTYGIFSGCFAGRALALLRLAQPGLQTRSA